MSTLLANSPVRSVAEILHAAAAVGHDAWATPMARRDPPSEVQLSRDVLARMDRASG